MSEPTYKLVTVDRAIPSNTKKIVLTKSSLQKPPPLTEDEVNEPKVRGQSLYEPLKPQLEPSPVPSRKLHLVTAVQ